MAPGGPDPPWNDPDRDLDRKVADSPWGLLVGEDGGTVIAAVMVGYDGHEVIAFHERRGYVLEPATHAVNLGRRLIVGPHAGSPVGSGAGDAAEGA